MSLRRTLSTAAVAVSLATAGLLTAPTAHAAPPPGATGWVTFGPHTSYAHCVQIGTYLSSPQMQLIDRWRCDSFAPYQLWVWK
ncbi:MULTISPECIES: hypothetical protein [unclassified Streptomyces]|uniref:hypothetical protein n=1 Tax=unclassified Streptomyces TaxID=2593676 RepID=UPI003650B948